MLIDIFDSQENLMNSLANINSIIEEEFEEFDEEWLVNNLNRFPREISKVVVVYVLLLLICAFSYKNDKKY